MKGVELEFATRQMAALLRAGMPLEQVLFALAEQSAKPSQRKIFTRLCEVVREGASLSQSLREFPKIFSAVYVALVAAGEKSGSLATVLDRLAEDLEARHQLRASLAQALAYPLIVTAVAILIVALLMSYVVPQIVEVLKSQGQDLPWLTWLLIGVSEFLSRWGGVIGLFAGFLLAGAWFFWRRSDHVKDWVEAWIFKFPGIGRMLALSEASRLCNTLSILLAGGVSLTSGLEMSAQACASRAWSRDLRRVQAWVQEGAGLAFALQKTGRFPGLLVQLIATGERTGDLSGLLQVGTREFSRELKMRSTLLAITLEPALILIMGLIVLAIVMAVMMPLIDMNRLIQ